MAVEAEAVPAVVAIRAAGDAPARSDALQPVRPPACVFLITPPISLPLDAPRPVGPPPLLAAGERQF